MKTQNYVGSISPSLGVGVGLKKHLTLLSFGLILQVLSGLLGAPFFRLMRRHSSSLWYWASFLALAAALVGGKQVLMASLVLASSVTVGLYCEWELRGRSGFWAALFSVAVGAVAGVLVSELSQRTVGLGALEQLESSLKASLEVWGVSGAVNPKSSRELLLQYGWGALVSVLIFNLGFSLALDRRIAFIFSLPYYQVSTQVRPLEFKLPEPLIWPLLGSGVLVVLGKNHTQFGEPLAAKLGVLGWNLILIFGSAYFFQGLAIFESGLRVLRAGFFVRFLMYFFVVGQFFMLLSLVGVVDYWMDFRAKFLKWDEKIKKKLSDGS